MPSPSDISSRIRARLRLTEPDLDTSVGTPTRKIIDVVAEEVSEASVDKYLLTYQYDIESRSGSDLDDFVRLFGFSRLPPRRATGQVTFSRPNPATDSILIPVNTRLATATLPQIVVSTTVPAILSVGDDEISVPCQALTPGTSGNVPADSVTLQLSSVQGFTSFTNALSFTGGVDAESDAALRDRFRKTALRGLAGTESMYAGTALEDSDVSQVNVIGSTKRYREQIQLVSGTATSTISGAKSIVPGSSFFGVDLEGGDILYEGVSYTISSAVPPVITSTSALAPDGIYELEFEYVPSASRNDHTDNVTSKIDLWVKGSRATDATETLVYNQAFVFQNANANDPWYRQSYVRDDGSFPVAGNYFIPYSFVPLVNGSITDQVVIDGLTLDNNDEWWMVHHTGPLGWSPQSYAGIEVKSTANGLPVSPANLSSFEVTYAFNAVPTDVQRAIQRWRLVNTDVWVHQAIPLRLNLYFAVILEPGFTSVSVQLEMVSAISKFIDAVGFNSTLQASDLLAVAHSVVGVDAVRFLTSTDNPTNYAIQRVNSLGVVQQTYAVGGRATDVFTDDDDAPVLNNIFLTVKAANSFGTV